MEFKYGSSDSDNSDEEYVICDRCCKPVHEDYIEKCATCGIELCHKCLTDKEKVDYFNRSGVECSLFTCTDQCYADYKEK